MLYGDYGGPAPEEGWDDPDIVYSYFDAFLGERASKGIDWTTLNVPPIGWEPVLRAAAKHGIRVLLGTPVEEDYLWIDPSQDQVSTNIKAMTAEIQGYPALLGYRLGDEPNSTGLGTGMAAVITAVKTLDPYHATAPCWWWRPTERATEYMKTQVSSAIYADCYTNWMGSHPPIGDFTAETDKTYSEYLEIFHDAAVQYGGKPLWWIDGFWKRKQGRGPTPTEARCSTYLMLAHGVRGIVHFRYLTYNGLPGITDTLSQVAKEMRTITGKIGSWRRVDPVATVDGGSTANYQPEIYTFQDKAGKFCLAYVNKNCTTAKTLTIHISRSAIGNPQHVKIVDLRSGDTLPCADTGGAELTLTDKLEPGDGKVVLLAN